MKGLTNPDGLVRLDFKGGWAGDKENKFTAAGRTAKENEAFNYVKKLANYRKNSPRPADRQIDAVSFRRMEFMCISGMMMKNCYGGDEYK